MRAVFVGSGSLSTSTARLLLEQGHDVVIVERDKERIEALGEELDCGFLHGDGSRPALLREADPEKTDFLFCLTGNDQSNIIASLVGRSLGFRRVVTKIEDPELEHICVELGLEETIVPEQTIGRFLSDTVAGLDTLELSAMVKNGARVFSFVARAQDAGPLDALDLPERTRIICLYRQEGFLLPEEAGALQVDDEVVLITHRDAFARLGERWPPRLENGA